MLAIKDGVGHVDPRHPEDGVVERLDVEDKNSVMTLKDPRGLGTRLCRGNGLRFHRNRREVTGSGHDQLSGLLRSVLHSI